MNTQGEEAVHCNLCGADNSALVFHIPVKEHQVGVYARDVWDLVRCRECGLTYLNPRPDEAALNALYTFDDPVDREFIQKWSVEKAAFRRNTWRRYLNILAQYGVSGRLLDLGCGAGDFLVVARESGYKVVGQDISPFFVEYCRTELGLEVFEKTIDQLPLPAGSLDLVTAFDVIEHHPDPTKMLQDIHHYLKPGGYMLVTTHDIGNLLARRYGVRWRQIAAIGHLTYFTKATLAALFERNGFRVLRAGSLHTIDTSPARETRNWITQFIKTFIVRGAIFGIYKPLASRFPALTGWRFRWQGVTIDHEKLLLRAGHQIIMNDDMVFLAQAV